MPTLLKKHRTVASFQFFLILFVILSTSMHAAPTRPQPVAPVCHPIAFRDRLLAAAREPKQLVEFRGSHNDAFLTSASAHYEGLKQFFASLPRN